MVNLLSEPHLFFWSFIPEGFYSWVDLPGLLFLINSFAYFYSKEYCLPSWFPHLNFNDKMIHLVFFLPLFRNTGMVQANTTQSLQQAWKLARTFLRNLSNHCSQMHAEDDLNTYACTSSLLGNLPKLITRVWMTPGYPVMFQHHHVYEELIAKVYSFICF